MIYLLFTYLLKNHLKVGLSNRNVDITRGLVVDDGYIDVIFHNSGKIANV